MDICNLDAAPEKIGIMGGTFNPIHIGHLLLAETALSQEKLHAVMFLPSGKSYMKQEDDILDAQHRIKMVELAIQDNPAFFVSDMEILRKGNTYTCDTLTQLKKAHPQNEYYFILGADCLFSIESWKDPQRIFAQCSILAAVRNGVALDRMQEKCEALKERYGARIKLLSFPETAISSTDIRKKVAEGKSIRYMVPEAVRNYIETNGLFQS